MRKTTGLAALGIGIGAAWILAILIVLISDLFHFSVTRELISDGILIISMISVVISLFAFSRYVVHRERLLEFIALAFLVGGFIRIVGLLVADVGIVGDARQAFNFQLAAWQGGGFLFALMLAIGTLLVWIFPKPKSTLFDVSAEVITAAIVVVVVVFFFQGMNIGSGFFHGNTRHLAILVAGFFLISFLGVSRNYLKYPTLFNYTISITLFLLTLGALVGTFSIVPGDVASVTHFGLTLFAFIIGAVGSLVDVGHIFSDYVRSSEGLKAANQELLKYQVYLEKVPDPVRIVNETGFTLYVNPAFEKSFGYSLAEMRTRPSDEMYAPGDREKLSAYAELAEQGMGSEIELSVLSRDGRRIDTLLNSAPIKIEGKRLGTITIYRDITGRKQLEHRAQVLSAAVENTGEAIALTAPDGTITFLNSAAEKLFGYTLDELPRQSLWALVSPSFGYNKAREIYVNTLRTGGWKGEVLNRRKDGTEYYISLATSSIKDTRGEIISLVGICEDVTDKKWEERRKEMAYRVAQMAFSSVSVSSLAESASSLLMEIIGAPLVALYSYDEKTTNLQLLAQRNSIGRNSDVPVVQGVGSEDGTNASRSAKFGKMVFSKSLSETEFAGFEDEPIFRDSNGLVTLPLITSGEVVGVFQYVSVAPPGNIKYEADLSEAAASELAVGIQKLRLGGKVAEQADQLEKIFASAAEGIALVDRIGRIVLMNEGGKKTFGLERIPEVGFSDFADKLGMFTLDGGNLSEAENPVRLAALEGRDIRNSELMIRRDGKERILSVSASPLIGSVRDVNGAVVIFSDITDQKKNELAIKKQNRRLSVINRTALAVKDALDVFEILNKSLTRLLEFEEVSAAAVFLLNETTRNLDLAASLGFSSAFTTSPDVQSVPIEGYILSDAMDIGVPQALPEISEHAQPTRLFGMLRSEMMQSAIAVPILGSRKAHGLLLAASKDKMEINLSDTEFFMMISRVLGGSVENALLYSDILEKSKELEDSNEQLRISKVWVEEANAQLVQANQQLEEASRLKSQFLANMSHELRTPLNSIIGFTNLVLTDEEQPPTGDQKEGLEIVLRNAKNLLALINDILDLSKIEAGKISISPEEFRIDTVTADALATVAPLLGDRPVKLLSEIGSDIPPIFSDAARVKQIVLNLLSNAAKFTEAGHIKIIVRMLEKNFVSLAVEDTGSGVPENYLEVIFEEFRQVDGSNTRKHGGTGLGLAISRKLARMLGGDLTVKSKVGEGSTFTLTLPVFYHVPEKQVRAEAVVVPPTSDATVETNNLIVCIDDDPEVLILLKKHLESEGFEFMGVSDSRVALETVRKQKPVLVTLDIMMPNKDGWQLLQELKADPELKEIPVIIHSVVDNKALAVSLGAESFIVKPVEPGKIISVVRKYTGTDGGDILVVDDNEDFTNFLGNLLEKSKFTISTARNGIEAVEFLRSRTPSLVFLDLLMPGMDGFGVVEKMYEDERLREVPVVVLTAKEITDEDRSVLNSRIKDIVKKEGLTREIILREVNKFIHRNENRSWN